MFFHMHTCEGTTQVDPLPFAHIVMKILAHMKLSYEPMGKFLKFKSYWQLGDC